MACVDRHLRGGCDVHVARLTTCNLHVTTWYHWELCVDDLADVVEASVGRKEVLHGVPSAVGALR